MKRFIGLILIAVGVVVLLKNLGYINLDWLHSIEWKIYIWPIVLIFVGINLLSSNNRKNRLETVKLSEPAEGEAIKISCCLTGNRSSLNGSRFYGAKIETLCGGAELDLRGAIIGQDVKIDISTLMGGVSLWVDKDVNIQVANSGFAGGVNNKTSNSTNANSKTILINAQCYFGGVSIQN